MSHPSLSQLEFKPPRRIPLRSRLILTAIVAIFFLLRGPVMFRQIPGLDEDYFAVPGYTILQEGVPRIPYLPARDPASGFYMADRVLYGLPPLSFYWQAAFYAVLGPSTGVARFANGVAGMVAVLLLYAIARQWFRDEAAALWSAGLYAFSRAVYFPCLSARPDMLCGMFGLAALWSVGRWRATGSRCWLAAAGGSVGLGLLSHPFALVYALVIGAWVTLATPADGVRRRWKDGLLNGGLVAAVAGAVFSLWLPLIALEPELFAQQFGNNVMRKSGPGLPHRLVLPAEAFQTQTPLFFEHVGPLPALLLLGGAAWLTAGALVQRERALRTAVCIAWAGVYLHVACQGTHPTKGYWCYTTAPLFVLLGATIAEGTRRLERSGGTGRMARGFVAMLVIGAFLPGAGLRTFAAHARNWNDISYDAPRFTRALLAELPSDAHFVVDPGYVFDFYRSGRSTLLAIRYPFFLDVSEARYDVLVAGATSFRDGVPPALEGRLARAVGETGDLFACYAEIFEAPPHRRPGPVEP